MKKFRYILILAVLIAVLVPLSASAGGVFYCSASVSSEGHSGTYYDPWACSTDDQLDFVVNDLICDNYYGGYLYQIFPSSYTLRVITWNDYGDCDITSTTTYAGYPPYSGVETPTPYIIGAAALAGAGLLAAGLIWRRKRAEA